MQEIENSRLKIWKLVRPTKLVDIILDACLSLYHNEEIWKRRNSDHYN